MLDKKRAEIEASDRSPAEKLKEYADYKAYINKEVVLGEQAKVNSERAAAMSEKRKNLWEKTMKTCMPIAKVGGAVMSAWKWTGNYGPNLIDRRGAKPENAAQMIEQANQKIGQAKGLRSQAETEADPTKKKEMLKQAELLEKEAKDEKDVAEKGKVIYQYKLGQFIRSSIIFGAGGVLMGGIAGAQALLWGVRVGRGVGLGMGGAIGLAKNEEALQTKLENYKDEKEKLEVQYNGVGKDITEYEAKMKVLADKERKAKILHNSLKVAIIAAMAGGNLASGNLKVGDTQIGFNVDKSMADGLEKAGEKIGEFFSDESNPEIPHEITPVAPFNADNWKKPDLSSLYPKAVDQDVLKDTKPDFYNLNTPKGNIAPDNTPIDPSKTGDLGLKSHIDNYRLAPNKVGDLSKFYDLGKYLTPNLNVENSPIDPNKAPNISKFYNLKDYITPQQSASGDIETLYKPGFNKPDVNTQNPSEHSTLKVTAPRESVIAPAEKVEYGKITQSVDVKEEGAVATVKALKEKVALQYKDVENPPENIKYILNNDEKTISEKWGLYDPTDPSGKESAMMLRGSKMFLDENGKVVLNNLGKGETILSGEGEQAYGGRMFDYDKNGPGSANGEGVTKGGMNINEAPEENGGGMNIGKAPEENTGANIYDADNDPSAAMYDPDAIEPEPRANIEPRADYINEEQVDTDDINQAKVEAAQASVYKDPEGIKIRSNAYEDAQGNIVRLDGKNVSLDGNQILVDGKVDDVLTERFQLERTKAIEGIDSKFFSFTKVAEKSPEWSHIQGVDVKALADPNNSIHKTFKASYPDGDEETYIKKLLRNAAREKIDVKTFRGTAEQLINEIAIKKLG